MIRWAVLLVASTLLLAGCASAPAADDPVAVDPAVSAALQSDVVEVANAGADGDYESALAHLDDLQSALDAAIADGSLTASKATSIQAAIDAVRADLTELAAPEPEPEPTTEPTEPEKPGNGNSGKPEKPGKPGKGNKDN